MTRDEIAKHVREILVVHLFLDRDRTVEDSDHMVEDLGCDSLDAIELVEAMEDHFCIDIDEQAAYRLTTVASVIELVAASSSLIEPSERAEG
jgi:acyl carrier protein